MGRHISSLGSLLFFAACAYAASGAGDAHFVGPETCALCHKNIAATQARSPMATTWQGRLTSWLPASFNTSIADDLHYEAKRSDSAFTYSVNFPDRPPLNLAIEILLGGRRHGLGFLMPIQQIDAIPLARPALVQARYAWSPEKNKLLLAPGCASARPSSVESALGLVLTPTFESRCLSCHGQPDVKGTGREGGVHCESCHGPGSQHLAALGHGNRTQGIVNPKRLSTEDSMAVCAQCHVGLARFSDPSPGDLLVANQVRAIRDSECFLQSGKAFSCTACHAPHSDAADDEKRSIQACLGCHTAGGKKLHAAICPVNATAACTGCHMPSVEMGPLHLVDHFIRVHPEQALSAGPQHNDDLRTQVQPLSEYLRMIATRTPEAAAAAQSRIFQGESFYKVARETSLDKTSAIGGYLGRKTLAELDGPVSAEVSHLAYGETSQAVKSGNRWLIFQRLPRDFRWDAEQLQHQAEDLASRGEAQTAIEKAQQALMIYPHLLRAISFIGVTFASSGNAKKAAEVLGVGSHLYPNDAGIEFARASALEMLGDREGATAGYKRAISLEVDFVAAYRSLGMLYYSSGNSREAIRTLRQGLQIDPMSAELYYDLGLALTQTGDTDAAKQALLLASKLDPGVASTDPGRSAPQHHLDSF